MDGREKLLDLLRAGQFSQRGAARELGISERAMRYYCAGDQPVPRVVLLALEHLASCPRRDIERGKRP
jgi:predicted transcriptional regulator